MTGVWQDTITCATVNYGHSVTWEFKCVSQGNANGDLHNLSVALISFFI